MLLAANGCACVHACVCVCVCHLCASVLQEAGAAALQAAVAAAAATPKEGTLLKEMLRVPQLHSMLVQVCP